MTPLGGILGSILGRVLAAKMPGLARLEPGRYPHPEYGPIVIPKSPDIERGESSYLPKFQITFPGFMAAWIGFMWYAKRRADRVQLAGEIDLFPGLRRELRMEPEDTATADDPVEACLQRRYGWNLNRVRELRESIAEKSTPDMFTKKQEEFTPSENELLANIEDCLERVEETYGSLEAAGLSDVPCDLCGEEAELA